jgi:hypothetical protein
MEIKCTKCGGSGEIRPHWPQSLFKPYPCPDCEGKGGHRPVVKDMCEACEGQGVINVQDRDTGIEYLKACPRSKNVINPCVDGVVSRPLTEDEWERLAKETETSTYMLPALIKFQMDAGIPLKLDGKPVTLEPYREGE